MTINGVPVCCACDALFSLNVVFLGFWGFWVDIIIGKITFRVFNSLRKIVIRRISFTKGRFADLLGNYN